MLTENQQKWVDALRSGNYGQGLLSLNPKKGMYCCLGVLCKVAEDNGVEVQRDINGLIEGSSLINHPKVRLWIGMNSRSKSYMWANLVELNDSQGYSFEQIADAIEANTEELFKQENKS